MLEHSHERSGVGRGLCLWLVLVPLIVAIRGVRWDEAFEHSAIIAGVVAYPQGHPLTQALFNQYTLQNYPSALLQLANAGALIINGFRNAIALYAVILPVYLVAAGVTRRALLGHVAALLTLQGIYLTFDSVYPMEVWPPFTSFGHIGMGWSLTALGVLVWGRMFTGGFLAGLAPLMHIGQFPPLFLSSLAFGPSLLLQRRFTDTARLVLGVAVAAACCAAFWWWHHAAMVTPPPTAGPYAAEGDVDLIWKNFTELLDTHRHLPGINSHIIVIAALGLAVAAWRTTVGEARHAAGLVLLYVWVCTGLVYGTLAVNEVLGEQTPFLVLAWMPYRVMNHAAPLALALSVIVLGTTGGAWGRVLLLITLFMAAGRTFAAPWLPEELYQRYLFEGDLFLFVLMGAALMVGFGRAWSPIVSFVLLAAACGVLSLWHQAGAAALAIGIVYGVLAEWASRAERMPTDEEFYRDVPPPAFGRGMTATAVVVLLLAAGFTGVDQYQRRQHLPRTPFELNVEREVREGGPPWAMLLADPGNLYVQCVYGVPVLLAQTTYTWISYMPELGPVINKMYTDIYGMRFDAPPDPNRGDDPMDNPLLGGFYTWHTTWRDRSAEEWRNLGRAYGFHYIIAPENDPLQLDELLHADGLRFYRVAPADGPLPEAFD